MEETILVHEIKTPLIQYRCEYSPSSKVMLKKWEGLSQASEIIEMFKKSMEFMEKHQVVALVQDGENMKGTFSKANQYLKDVVIPFYDKHSVKYNSIALTIDVFTRFALNSLLKVIKTKVEVTVYKRFSDAKNYLEEKMAVKLPW